MKLFERGSWVVAFLLLASTQAAAQGSRPLNRSLFGTRAIVACDAVEQSCGMAVISFPSGVSGLVPYGRSDIAVATMALPSVDDAQGVIARIDAGEAPQAAIDAVLALDPYAPIRQLAAVKLHPDGSVTTGQRSGAQTSAHTCAIQGATFVVQANNMSTPDMCTAMAAGFQRAKGSLPQRLYTSLQYGARVGGDNNGERSGVIRVWNTTSETAFYTHVLAEAVVHGSTKALQELGVQLHRYQGTLADVYAQDRVTLTADIARDVKQVLRKLGYYRGPMDGSWSDAAEQALYDFNWNNLFFLKPTVVEGGTRKIDGVLVKFLRDADLGALTRATASAE
ncbi:Uncharacterized conserved protein, Ntn-hydrolase superfamily [Myxococcus fulvus]|uniref:Uncharacterized conserved protein, Ntn-hydrolase superfamily n=1 Tax=Myxococcus fulvus TaxID=33 RepID=A0A511T1Q5_MYXFU|nr:DUF1028 domain-containing protein [Myxococcus fulvus]GEN07572.1 hypothetical protein MFU01_26090 [Myxococcus fulvus]SES86628.1 Uncharacterized conserved protein, Ntn-hydrolase superfamily [Myxococcus fulvus]